MAIDKTFTDLHAQRVEDIQHPDGKKRALKVVEVSASPALWSLTLETYDILPDHDVWSNAYTMVRFPERPSAATAAVRLSSCIGLITESLRRRLVSSSCEVRPPTCHRRRPFARGVLPPSRGRFGAFGKRIRPPCG
jgi:hypothetical protein